MNESSRTDAQAPALGGLPYSEGWLRAWEKAFVDASGWLGPLTLPQSEGEPTGLTIGWARQKVGPVPVASVAGWYWPARGVGMLGSALVPAELERLADELHRAVRWLPLRMGPVVSDDVPTQRLLGALKARGFSIWRREVGAVMRIGLASGCRIEDRASRSLLKNLAYLRRRTAKDLGQVTSERVVLSAGNVATTLNRVAAIETSSWVVGRNADAKFVGERNQVFWTALAAEPSSGWQPVVWILSAGGRDLAFSAHLEHGQCVWIIANSYIEEHAALSPGSLLTEDVIADAIARGVRVIDWGQGDSGYKGRWGAVAAASLHDHLCVAPGLVQSIFDLLAARRLQAWSRL